MTGLLFAGVVLVTAMVWLKRRLAARGARARWRRGAGTSVEDAIAVRSFEDIDRAIAARRCHCGGRVRAVGEGTRDLGARRLRHARIECYECEDEQRLYFDVSQLLQ